MARPNGTILRLVIEPQGEIADPSELGASPVQVTMYVADTGNTPYPGIGVDLGGTDFDSVNVYTAKPAADLYTLATTGSLP